MSDLKPKSYFFTQLTSSVQTEGQIFGPVVGSETTQFRTTAKFTAVSDVKAYAICTGQVFIQPGETVGTINLILRPYRQPVKGMAIKYFIYRGLKKTDFIPSGNTNLIAYENLENASGFINVIWEQLKKFNDWDNDEAENQVFPAKWIGYDPDNQPEESEIDDYFFAANAVADDNDEELKPFEFPIIKAGTHLGDFSGEYGLDIVLSDGDYKPLSSDTGFQFNLAYARVSEGIINTQNLPTNTTEKQYREAVFNFMAPAAYYGLHYTGGKVFVANGAEAHDIKEGQAIYVEILDNFATKNNVYIYLQNHLGRSYNYYDNYTNISTTGGVLKSGIDIDSLQTILPTTHNWPLLIQNETQNHSENTNTIYIQFAVGNQTPLCFGQIGKLVGAENNFLVTNQLLPIQPEPVNGQVAEINIFSQPVSLVIPAIAGTGDIRNNITSYAKLIYSGANLIATELVDSNPIEHQIKTIDTLFNPIHIAPRFANPDQDVISWCISHKNSLIDTTLINNSNTSKIVTQTKVVYDKLAYRENEEVFIQDRVIYETQLIEGIGKGLFARSNSSTSSYNAGSIIFSNESNNFYLVSQPYFFLTKVFTDSTLLIKGLTIHNTDVNSNINNYVLGLDKNENDILKGLIDSNILVNSYIYLKNILNNDNDFITSKEGINYKKYNIGITSEDVSGNLIIIYPEENINVYTIDSSLFFSREYGLHMPDLAINELVSNFEIPELL